MFVSIGNVIDSVIVKAGGFMKSMFLKGIIFSLLYFYFCAATQAEHHNSIIIATHIDPPSIYLKDGQFAGHNVDVANMLVNAINKKAAFVYCPFARCLTMLKDGQADMMIALNKTEERQNYISYLEQPFHSLITPVKFYSSKHKNINVEKYEDLQGLNIGVLRGASYFKRFDNDESLKKVYITTHRQLIDLLVKGRIDTFLGREISIKHQVSPQIYTEELKEMSYVYSKENDFYIGISQKSKFNEQVNYLSKVLDELLASGAIAELDNPYL